MNDLIALGLVLVLGVAALAGLSILTVGAYEKREARRQAERERQAAARLVSRRPAGGLYELNGRRSGAGAASPGRSSSASTSSNRDDGPDLMSPLNPLSPLYFGNSETRHDGPSVSTHDRCGGHHHSHDHGSSSYSDSGSSWSSSDSSSSSSSSDSSSSSSSCD